MALELDCEEYFVDDAAMTTATSPEDIDMELVDDWYSSMLAQERAQFHYAPQPHYLKVRLVLVDWTCDVGEELDVPKSIVHTAVNYLDRLLNVPCALPPQSKLQLVCLVCLWIATKFASVDCEVPSIEEIYAYGHQQYTLDEIKAYEMATLKALHWQLNVLQPIHFTEFYLTNPPLFPDDDINGYQLADPTAYATVYTKHVEFLTEMCLQEHAFQQWLPSVLATAMLCVARRIVHITPVWREEIEINSGYVVDEIQDCFHAMWSHYVHHFSKGTADEPSPTSVAAVSQYQHHQ
ncbi:hypothetical protein H257_13690 [Aphanomyces astaci]|uniref:Cyclin N-terminal domain-containing protein n=3 Tax=Aphanomyces astaci TaxID=112090 RepID=W4FU09_APHAT|nr:hypothetical protein H257_13690 [Aphanomyces astaci]ETV70952.1 hypothetical protein H257_13690 [Aphanomyces astaci]|eukprot:XP_009839615.1 hypothetical protein H257_13690 [Aphanomyces astaci]